MSRKRKHGAGRPHRKLPRFVCAACGARYRSTVRKSASLRRCPECADAAYRAMALENRMDLRR